MKIKITADSTCDLSAELLQKWDITLMPMHILMGEDSYLDGVTIHPADVFTYVNGGGKMPKSLAITRGTTTRSSTSRSAASFRPATRTQSWPQRTLQTSMWWTARTSAPGRAILC